jgi:hypothetical protein
MQHPRSRDRATLVQQKHHAHSASDQAQLQHAFLIHGAVQLRGYGYRAVFRVTGNSDGMAAQAFDPVMAALGLNVNDGATRQALAIHKFD